MTSCNLHSCHHEGASLTVTLFFNVTMVLRVFVYPCDVIFVVFAQQVHNTRKLESVSKKPGLSITQDFSFFLHNFCPFFCREPAINPHISICKPPLAENMVCGPINFFRNVYVGAQVQKACGPCAQGLMCKQVGYVLAL